MPRGKAAAPVAKGPEIMESPVRTKFPTARIKRIMQADEEVGKVAQQTPIAVGKALELFMVQLVHKSAEVAKEKNSKRISATMLKQAIDSTNEWDFLRDIVAKVTEEKEGAKSGGRTKADSESDDDVEAGEVKKKGRGGRKKKAAA
jgi:histone H3/H4